MKLPQFSVLVERPARLRTAPRHLSLALGLSACLLATSSCSSSDDDDDGGGAADSTAPGFVVLPVLTPNPNPDVLLAARITLTTDEPAEIELEIDDGVDIWRVTPEPGFRMDHVLPVLGVKSDRTHLISIEARDPSGNLSTSGPLVFQTAPQPAKFPPIVFNQVDHDPSRMEPGVTFLNVRTVDPAITDGWGMLLAVDEDGEPIWYFQARHEINDARRLANGNILYGYDRLGVVEIDMFGDVVGAWWAANQVTPTPAGHVPVLVDTLHHEVFEMPAGAPDVGGLPAGDFVSISTELEELSDYPLDVTDPSMTNPVDTNVIGDVIVEFRRDGSIVAEWSMLDILDPYRLSYGSLGTFWDSVYGVPTVDWSHVNGVVYDATDDTWVISVRHLEAVIKIERQTGAIVWILGPPEGWIPPWTNSLLDPGPDDPVLLGQGAQPFEWLYHQHAPQVLPGGDILVFDNGNGRAFPPDPELPLQMRYSRAVRYAVDTTARTATQVWSYGGASDPWYSGFLGDADQLPTTQNVLITDGGKNDGSQLTGRVLEVTQEVVPEVVFEFELREADPGNAIGWTIYRAERFPSIYP